jgi:hypothetical protein
MKRLMLLFFALALTGCGMMPQSVTDTTTATPAPITTAIPTPSPTPAPPTTGQLAGHTFHLTPFQFGPWPDTPGPYHPPAQPGGNRDATGALLVFRGSKPVFHPQDQSIDGLWALARYEATRQARDWRIALADAHRLVAKRITAAGAWWFPYSFNFVEYGEVPLPAPWFSGMAQGQALYLFSQLFLATGQALWRYAADRTFASFLQPYHPGIRTPWITRIEQGRLWIEEYPQAALDVSVNGLGFAIWGLIEYSRVFGNDQASLLAQAALTSYLHAIPLIRHPGGICGYSLSHPWDLITRYHRVVTYQLQVFAAITGNRHIAQLARAFSADFP